MTYADAITFLSQARRFGMKLGLETMRDLAHGLGDPQDRLRFIHIAGTNGKGSTAAFCESILRAAGFRVGLYTSPHLVSVRERIQVNREPISEIAFGEGMEAVQRAIREEVTFFELMTALALWHFEREKVDWVVWETGLGGRLDATNIVMPEVCIITNIGLDHQQYLGRTIREIATEKAGILKPGVRSVVTTADGESLSVILQRSYEVKCRVQIVDNDEDLGFRNGKQLSKIDGKEFALGLLGPHQIANAGCAVIAMEDLASIGDQAEVKLLSSRLTDANIARGLEFTSWPGRFEVLSENPLTVLDGAHNAAAMKTLIETWRAFLKSKGWSDAQIADGAHVVFGAVADKDVSEMAQLLIPIAKNFTLVRLANERTADPQKLAEAFSARPCDCNNSVTELWPSIVSPREEPMLITGSLFLAGEILAQRQGNAEEYWLNERLEKSTPVR